MKKALGILAGLICLGMLGVRGEGNDRFRTEFAGRRNRLFRNGKPVSFADCLREQSRRYPEMEAADAVKLAYQAAYGAYHGVRNKEAAWKNFTAEYAAAAPEPGPLCEVISPDVCRIDLRAWKAAGLPEQWLFNLFCSPGEPFTDGDEVFADCCRQAEEVLPQLREPLRAFLKHHRGGPVRHSETYRAKYRPSYRLVSTRYLPLLPVLVKAASLPEKPVRIIAVDGRAASGKTTLAGQLTAVLEAGVIHMDDFFLPPELRTAGRLAEPGGNVHYERFVKEVLPKLGVCRPFSYRKFDCSTMQPGEIREVPASAWRIVEGAYSFHPRFGSYADLKVFYDISGKRQMERILRRNGKKAAKVFASRWIPMEENYISATGAPAKADIVLGAGE